MVQVTRVPRSTVSWAGAKAESWMVTEAVLAGGAVGVGLAVRVAVGDGVGVGDAVAGGVAVAAGNGVAVRAGVGVGVAAPPQAERSKGSTRNRNKAIFLTVSPFCVWPFPGFSENYLKFSNNLEDSQTLAEEASLPGLGAFARMGRGGAGMADRRGLGPRALGRGGSNPPLPTLPATEALVTAVGGAK